MDDCLSSVETIDEALEVVHGCKKVLLEGGFNLTKFIINDVDVLSTIPIQDRAKDVKDLSFDTSSKALGIQWDVGSDCFYFDVKFSSDLCDHMIITKRTVLSFNCSIYDPLGFLNPLVLKGKLYFQDLCRKKFSWDQPIPDYLLVEWKSWISSLHGLNSLYIPRCLNPYVSKDTVIELHHFNDASERAMGCCSYLRVLNMKGHIHVNKDMSKSVSSA